MQLKMIKLKKHFGANVIGETAGFTEETAKHIMAHQGGEIVAEFDATTHRFDPTIGKAVPLRAKAA